jgi:hypothetical protein
MTWLAISNETVQWLKICETHWIQSVVELFGAKLGTEKTAERLNDIQVGSNQMNCVVQMSRRIKRVVI